MQLGHRLSRELGQRLRGQHASSKVVVAMSGGVDSSVAAVLLKQCFPPNAVTGLYMNNWDGKEEGECPGEADRRDAEDVCRHLSIPFLCVDFVKEYWHDVFQDFLQQYQRGNTPNPDIFCNRYIKFSALKHHALHELGADYLATGHYARVYTLPSDQPPSARLVSGVDELKDQSYFLSMVMPGALDNVVFPLGGLQKSQTRQIAVEEGLPTAKKKESMGVCFVGKRNLPTFLHDYIQPTPGQLICVDDNSFVATHPDMNTLTIGQRARVGEHTPSRHLNPGGRSGGAWYVCEKDQHHAKVYLAKGRDHPALLVSAVTIDRVSWLSGRFPDSSKGEELAAVQERHVRPGRRYHCLARLRHRGELVPCTVFSVDSVADNNSAADETADVRTAELSNNANNSDNNSDNNDSNNISVCSVEFDKPQWGVSPGQIVAFYRALEPDTVDLESTNLYECLGAGRCLKVGPSNFHRSVPVLDKNTCTQQPSPLSSKPT